MRSAKTAFVYDLDSTLRSSLQRHHLSPVLGGQRAKEDGGGLTLADWHEYAAAGVDDAPQLGVIAVMRDQFGLHQIHICSGSSATAEAETRSWLTRHAPYFDYLKLRTADEEGTDIGLVKAQYVLGLQAKGIEVLAFFEDWPPNAKTITEKTGVPCVVVNPVYPDMCTCGYAG